jgi:hypothetical protein
MEKNYSLLIVPGSDGEIFVGNRSVLNNAYNTKAHYDNVLTIEPHTPLGFLLTDLARPVISVVCLSSEVILL